MRKRGLSAKAAQEPDPRLIELVRFMARRAAERDYKLLARKEAKAKKSRSKKED